MVLHNSSWVSLSACQAAQTTTMSAVFDVLYDSKGESVNLLSVTAHCNSSGGEHKIIPDLDSAKLY